MTAFIGLLLREAAKVATRFLRMWIGSRCDVPERFLAFVNACQIVANWSLSLMLALVSAVEK